MRKLITIILAITILLGVSAWSQAASKTFPIKGKVTNLVTGQGVSGISIGGTSISTTTGSDGKFSFDIVSSTGVPIAFTINTPSSLPSGFRAMYASNNNISNFWETSYLSQAAGLRCRSENAFCSPLEAWRDKGSSSRYDFVLEPSISCTSATSTAKTIPMTAPDGSTVSITMSSEPGVAADGSRAIVAAAGSDGKLWINTSTNLSGNKWSGWVQVGSGGGTVSSPAPRALGRTKYAIFWTEGTSKFAVLRDASKSRSGIVNLTSISEDTSSFIGDTTPRNAITFKGVNYRFTKSGSNIQYTGSCT